MIDQAKGMVVRVHERAVCLAVGQLVWQFDVASPHEYPVGSEQSLYVYMYWNQEQGPRLYGFGQELERILFCATISCSGIGPRIALSMLADLGAHGLLMALRDADSRALSKVNGIGIKKAEQVIVQLRHKAEKLLEAYPVEGGAISANWQSVREALESLNYSRVEIVRVMDHIRKDQTDKASSFDQLMRSALAFLAKQP